ncbi:MULTISPECIES: TetR family transcriptional regulator [Streptococcus]|uniref:Transcriptional regulator, TetR family n=2 Tax=Streptococcus TaxID=1301 RepID=A0A139MY10_STRCR|nr:MULTISPECIES: TetR family transcriptional regulator [Streptococcus]KXT68414.1 Transcriptional regulator, TetR family [Streptococcus cristatus]KXT85656.1 Transcriptional regulator, TetR family [Streptococcus oralis]
MPQDLRIKKTKLAIRQAVLGLLAEKPFKKITVAEIIHTAEINRGTFYAHYLDKYDLLEKIEMEVGEEFSAAIQDLTSRTLQENWEQGDSFDHILPILTYVEENQELFKLMAERKLSSAWFDDIVATYFQSIFPREAGDDVWALYKQDVLKASIVATANRWVLGGCRENKEDLASWMTETEQLILFDHT